MCMSIEKPMYKGTCVIQTHVVQGSTTIQQFNMIIRMATDTHLDICLKTIFL